MKKFLMLLSLSALPFAFTSCGSDDGGGFMGISLDEPVNKELSEKIYKATGSQIPAGMTAGEILLFLSENNTAVLKSTGEDILRDVPMGVRKLKDEDSNTYIYVTQYTKGEDDVITFAFGGTFSLSGNALTLNAGPYAGVQLAMSALSSGVNIAAALDKACRTWNVIQTNIQVSGGDLGSDTYSKNFRGAAANNLVTIADDIDAQEKLANVNMGGRLKDNDRYTTIKDVTLSKSGTIVIRYGNDKYDVGELAGIDAGGKVSITWPDSFYSNEYLSGELGITATLENNCLRLAFNSEVYGENKAAAPYKVRVEFTMEWVGNK